MQRFILIVSILCVSPVYAKTIHVDNTLSSDCVGTTYNIATRACTGSDSYAYNDFATAIPTLVPGDTMRIRGAIYTERMNFQDAGISGSSGNYITVEGYPGETVIFRTTSSSTASYGPIKIRGAGFGWFIFRNFTLDGSLETDNTMWQIRDGNHDFILEDLIIENFAGSTLLMKDVSNITVRRCILRNTRNISTSSFYGTYFSVGTNVTIEDSQYYGNGGGGMHFYPGPISGLTVRRNKIHDNNNRTGGNIPVGGIVVYENAVVGGAINTVELYDNKIYNNGTIAGVGNGGSGIYLGGAASTDGPDGTKIYNNTIYGQNGGTTGWSQCIRVVTTATSNTDIKNNICLNNQHGEISDAGTSTTISYNGCLSTKMCGTTGKVTFASITEPFISSSDFRLKQGTNPARNSGTSVSTRTSPIGVTDLGAYEQGEISSASVVSAYIEAIVNTMTAGLLPLTGITGFTVSCGGASPCTGTPVVSSAVVKNGSGNTVQIGLSGIVTSGTCTLSLGSSNLTDQGFIGGPTGTAQFINSASAVSVAGMCSNVSIVTGGNEANFIW